MSMVFSRDVAIPVSAVALGVAILGAPPVVRSPAIALLGVVVVLSTVPVILRWVRRSAPSLIEVLPAPVLARFTPRNVEAEDAADLARMDGDAG